MECFLSLASCDVYTHTFWKALKKFLLLDLSSFSRVFSIAFWLGNPSKALTASLLLSQHARHSTIGPVSENKNIIHFSFVCESG